MPLGCECVRYHGVFGYLVTWMWVVPFWNSPRFLWFANTEYAVVLAEIFLGRWPLNFVHSGSLSSFFSDHVLISWKSSSSLTIFTVITVFASANVNYLVLIQEPKVWCRYRSPTRDDLLCPQETWRGHKHSGENRRLGNLCMTYLPISLAEAKTFTGVAANTSFYSQPIGVADLGQWDSPLAPLNWT